MRLNEMAGHDILTKLRNNYWKLRSRAIAVYGPEARPDPTICEQMTRAIADYLSDLNVPNLIVGGDLEYDDIGDHLWNLANDNGLILIDGSWYQGHYAKRVRLKHPVAGVASGSVRKLLALLDLSDLGRVTASRSFSGRGLRVPLTTGEIESLRTELLPHLLRATPLNGWDAQIKLGYTPLTWNKSLGRSFGAPR